MNKFKIFINSKFKNKTNITNQSDIENHRKSNQISASRGEKCQLYTGYDEMVNNYRANLNSHSKEIYKPSLRDKDKIGIYTSTNAYNTDSNCLENYESNIHNMRLSNLEVLLINQTIANKKNIIKLQKLSNSLIQMVKSNLRLKSRQRTINYSVARKYTKRVSLNDKKKKKKNLKSKILSEKEILDNLTCNLTTNTNISSNLDNNKTKNSYQSTYLNSTWNEVSEHESTIKSLNNSSNMTSTLHLTQRPTKKPIYCIELSGRDLTTFKKLNQLEETLGLVKELESKLKIVKLDSIQLVKDKENRMFVSIKTTDKSSIDTIKSSTTKIFGGTNIINDYVQTPESGLTVLMQNFSSTINEQIDPTKNRLETEFKLKNIKRLTLPNGTPSNTLQADCKDEKIFFDLITKGIYLENGTRSSVSPYFKKPSICSNCVSYGHYHTVCKEICSTCILCGEKHHWSMCLSQQPFCTHCKLANDRDSGTRNLTHKCFEPECEIYQTEFNKLNFEYIKTIDKMNIKNELKYTITIPKDFNVFNTRQKTTINNRNEYKHEFEMRINNLEHKYNSLDTKVTKVESSIEFLSKETSKNTEMTNQILKSQKTTEKLLKQLVSKNKKTKNPRSNKRHCPEEQNTESEKTETSNSSDDE